MAAPPRPLEGIQFPADDKGERGSTAVQKEIWAATFRAIGDNETANKIQAERNLRFSYAKYVNQHVRASLLSKENALRSAAAGLEVMHQKFDFIRDGKTYKLAQAMTLPGSFSTGFVQGEKPKPQNGYSLEVPYKGKILKDEALIKQLQAWAKYGTIEPSAADAISAVVKNKNWSDLSDTYFVLLGAGSAMGPFLVLLALGANVIALDLDRAPIWERLINTARKSSGTLTFPLKKAQDSLGSDKELYENAGSNLMTQTPEILNWLLEVYPGKPLVVGCYVYLDGEAHVRVVLACDAIMQGLQARRKNLTFAYLCTPTDTHVIPQEALFAASRNYASLGIKNLLVLPIRTLFGSKYLKRNVQPPITSKDQKNTFHIVDGLVVAQGPNYALAKRMQHWRCILGREEGVRISSNIAPSTATASVVHNKQFAWAYDGMPYFKPMEIFQQETSNAVMGALLINDIRDPTGVANPSVALANPLELFKYNSFHGGVWRCAYTIGSIGEVSVLIHFAKVFKTLLIVFLALFVVLLAVVWKFYF